jgi:DHA2 family methylenomycin A resistance protein-like MFS transporter
VASATLNSMRQTGSVIGVALFGSLLAGRGQVGSGTQVALGISIGLLVVAAGLAVWLEAASREGPAVPGGADGVSCSRRREPSRPARGS